MKRQFPNIDMFDHVGTVFIDMMHNLTVGVFERLDITSPMDVDKMPAYTQRILGGSALTNY